MATTTISKSIPVPKKRAEGLAVMIRTIINARTPLGLACFYGVLIVLLIAALYPTIAKANLGSYVSSSLLSGILGAHITNLSGFTTSLPVQVSTTNYQLLFRPFL